MNLIGGEKKSAVDIAYLLNKAVNALRSGDYKLAGALLDQIENGKSKHPKIGYLRAVAYRLEGNLNAALDRINIVAKHSTKNADAYNLMGLIYYDLGDVVKAEKAYAKASQCEPSAVEPLINLATLYKKIGKFQRALDTLRRAERLAPNAASVLVEIADLHRLMSSPLEAEVISNRVLAVEPENVLAMANKAWSKIRQGDLDSASTLLTKCLHLDRGSYLSVASIFNELGQAFEERGDFSNAWGAFVSQNSSTQRWAKSYVSTNSHYSIALIRELSRFYETLQDRSVQSASEQASPIFLVGFPRSGTTLFEQILAAHPAIATSDESPHVAGILTKAGVDAKSWEQFINIDAEERAYLQREYWASVPKRVPRQPNRFVDKLPQNLAYLGLIATVFPNAQVIFVMRDPRDAVLSAYKQYFQINPSTISMLDIVETANYFDETMLAAEAALKRATSLRVLRVKYEDLVNDFMQTTTSMIEFLGLNWDENILRYRELSSGRAISTPSAAQVAKPLYSSSVGMWKNYSSQLEIVSSILNRWVTYYNYKT